MLNKVLYLFVLLILASCHDKKNNEKIGVVRYDYPSNWKKISNNSIDSKVIIYKTSNYDSIFAEYGKYNNRFNENKIIVGNDSLFQFIKSHNPNSEIILAFDEELDNNQGIFLDNYYYYDKIDNHVVKVMLPKKSKKGQMGIYIKNIDKEGNSFSIYSNRPLKEKDSLDFLKIFKTIKINKATH
ncbi:hypothetical protein [Chryseobacterium balustinum]|uniref:Uncharacterized protein n=1 Tax=Chryseobacterium balustinum TaxID=246 RepID=A0ABY1LIQ4_9FLAO|nr:hypothetical protein [Chryseobacterium balustinum]AZB28660.1 hypothetical protein EB354_04955 [Chryseobacterium balustinum]SKC14189.1 hypothetical protein SAMN05421800_1506 [Chryseobacterium balustinum]